MGQQEVYDYLKRNHTKWFTSRQIAQGLRVSLGSVTNNLKKLRKTNSVKYSQEGNRFKYKFKK
ncbi:hypothetical protein JW930_03665 [Candidatus Woesearchaeota archaeon]|nr:hypothetical protein [Candidatus Woesearchaeota archaeon]